MKSWSSLLSIAMSHWIQTNYIYIKCFLVFAHDNFLHGKAPQSAQWGCPWLLLSTVKSHVGAPSPYSAYSSNWGPSKTDGLSMGVTFQGGSYLPFYNIKRWVPTPLGVYKLKVPTPLRHYNLNTVAPNQSPEINRKKPSDYKMAGADPPKKNSYNETACWTCR